MICKKLMKSAVAAALALTLLTGCKSKDEQAIDTAKKQAAATGQAQQVVSADKAGNITTTTVQPPAPGQTAQTVSTTYTPAASVPANQPALAGGQPAPPVPTPDSAIIIRPADVNIPAGTNLAIRINQHISVKSSQSGDHFDGEFVEPVSTQNGQLMIPRGTPVRGVVVEAHRRGHFKGSSILELRLTSLTLNGNRYPISTSDLTRTKKGKGKRSAAFIGGGTGLGMLIGGVATGGVGLVVGGLAGAGAGTAISGFTGNRDIEIPAESIVHFRLADDLVLQQPGPQQPNGQQ